METNHDHELPLLQGQANDASNNNNATNTNNSVGEDDLIESELGSEIDHVIGAVVDSKEKKKEKQHNITQLPGNNDVPSYVISSGLYLVLGAVLKKRLGAKRVAFSFYNTLKQAMETVPDELPTIIQQRFDLVILGDDKELRYFDKLDGLTDLPTLEQETRHYNTVYHGLADRINSVFSSLRTNDHIKFFPSLELQGLINNRRKCDNLLSSFRLPRYYFTFRVQATTDSWRNWFITIRNGTSMVFATMLQLRKVSSIMLGRPIDIEIERTFLVITFDGT
ncbi:unknown protein [Seminavis robusta]|uniref:Uncharacterized protein n=1 Tax=Seminavis robusta TaxID=568900 RepID=A0A9N8E6W1_9STRA|nr:unknown protein [Seminavis robusta]|eukprot:Sro715_g191770.1 n/a (279) ;mRNA; r:24218-25131